MVKQFALEPLGAVERSEGALIVGRGMIDHRDISSSSVFTTSGVAAVTSLSESVRQAQDDPPPPQNASSCDTHTHTHTSHLSLQVGIIAVFTTSGMAVGMTFGALAFVCIFTTKVVVHSTPPRQQRVTTARGIHHVV